jgi:O-antigen/teichoic acid export membrane protein
MNENLAKNVLLNMVGIGLPMIVAFITIPFLIDGLGIERFGILTLAWMVVGYFNLFDLGLGRALTKLVAEKRGSGEYDEIPSLIWTTLILMIGLGFVGGGVVFYMSPWLIGQVLNIPEDLKTETVTSLYILALSIPVVISSAGLRGVLEAYQKFGLINYIRIPQGIMTFLGPLLVLVFTDSLTMIVALLVFLRIVSWCGYILLCSQVVPELCKFLWIKTEKIKPLMHFGGWMTVSNIIGPIMVYMDRFVIGSVISMAAVTYYAAPYEIVTKLWLIPTALMGVIFPAFSSALSIGDNRVNSLFKSAIKFIFISLFPLVLIIITFSYDVLGLWLGAGFASHSGFLLQLLAIGVFINGLAQVPFSFVQSAGRADWTAKSHLVELPLYLILLWWLLNDYGVVGAAIAWVTRASLDAIVLLFLSSKIITIKLSPKNLVGAGGSLIFFMLGICISNLMVKFVFIIVVLLLFGLFCWKIVLDSGDKEFMLKKYKSIVV